MSPYSDGNRPRLAPKALCLLAGLAVSATATAQPGGPFNEKDVPETDAKVEVSEHMTVDLHVQDEDLANVLQLLSLQSQKNILVADSVSATVNANLYDVTFYEALDAVLNVNGYGYVEKGSFIYVYTLEEIAEIEEAQRQPVTRVVKLNYLNANDAAEFVAPLLSEIGQIKTNGDVDAFSIPDGSPIGAETFALTATVMIHDYPEHVEEIEKLIAQMDTRPAQVLVEATILETSLREQNGFGIDFSFISDVDFTDFTEIGGPLGAAQGLIQGGTGTEEGGGFSPPDSQGVGGTSTAGNTASGNGTFKLGVVTDNVSVFLRLLDEIADTTILSNPKILALNRQPARVLVGRRIGYLSSTSTETSTTQTVEFLDTGTQLNFRAFVGEDGFVRMELHPAVSTGETNTATTSGGAAVTIPEEVTQQITTNVIVRDGSTIVLGGLFRESTTLSRRQVPVLGDIPIIGAAFRGHDDDTRRSEIIFMITPTIVNDQVLAEQGDRAKDLVEKVRTGTRQGLLPFSRDRMTASLNVEAERAALDGDTQKALFLLRRSLEMNSNQADAIQLRERLLQKPDLWPGRSVLDSVFDEDVQRRLDEIDERVAEPMSRTEPGKRSEPTNKSAGQDLSDGDGATEQSASKRKPSKTAPTQGDTQGQARSRARAKAAEQPEAGAQQQADAAAKALEEIDPDMAEFVQGEGGQADEPVADADRMAPPAEPFPDDESAAMFDALVGGEPKAGDPAQPEPTKTVAENAPPAGQQTPEVATTADAQDKPTARERMLRDLRLTVTLSPSEGEPDPNKTTVTLLPDAGLAGGDGEMESQQQNADPFEGAPALTDVPFDGMETGGPRSAADPFENAPPLTDKRFDASGEPIEGGDPFRGAPTLLQGPWDGGFTPIPGLIGPAFVSGEQDKPGYQPADTQIPDLLFGGAWTWFRDAATLDKGEPDADEDGETIVTDAGVDDEQ